MKFILNKVTNIRSVATVAAISSLVLSTACWPPGVGGDTTIYDNEGAAVVHPNSHQVHQLVGEVEEVALSAGQAMSVTVQFDGCIGCEDIDEIGCSVSVEGDRIDVTAYAETTKRNYMFCPAVCGSLTTTCALGVLDEGEFLLSYGGQQVSLSVPSVSSPIVGESGL